MSCNDQKDLTCSPFQLTKTALTDNNLIDSVMNESLNIGAANIHVFKMLGVHEQGSLVDLVGHGNAISGGDGNTYPSSNAFDIYCTEWRSSQKGAAVTASAYIGYDFGEIKLENGRVRYGVDTSIKYRIATLAIKQGTLAQNRATKVRVERSSDGKNWYGVSIITLPDNDALNTVNFKATVQERYWRLRPVAFNGGTNDHWAVQALELMDYDATDITNIQDPIFQENRDRDYASQSVTLKGYYDLVDAHSELTKYGLELPTQSFVFRINFTACVQLIGRPLAIGDIIEMPSETQYSPDLTPVLKYVEVTDVGWSTEGYTPGWIPNTLQVIAQPMLASQETQDIFGGLAGTQDATGLIDINDGNHPVFQDISNFDQSVKEQATLATPERGREGQATVREFTQDELNTGSAAGVSPENMAKLALNSNSLYAEDAMPPNGESYLTISGDSNLPVTASDGDYARVIYTGLAEDVPARLYRFSSAKNRWIYLETDRRAEFNDLRPKLQEFLKNGVEPQNIDSNKPPISGEGTLEE